MHTSGGRVSVTINGTNYSARGVIKLAVSNVNVSVGANQDGSGYRTVAPKLRTATITFDRFVDINNTPLQWDETIFASTNFGCTFIEQDTGLTHIISNACFTGDPELDTSTGEVDGVGIAGETYKMVNS